MRDSDFASCFSSLSYFVILPWRVAIVQFFPLINAKGELLLVPSKNNFSLPEQNKHDHVAQSMTDWGKKRMVLITR
jgi:hypothetical protein